MKTVADSMDKIAKAWKIVSALKFGKPLEFPSSSPSENGYRAKITSPHIESEKVIKAEIEKIPKQKKTEELTPEPSVFTPFQTLPGLGIEQFQISESLVAEYDRLEQERLKSIQDFNSQYADLGKNQFELERENIEKQAKLWRQSGADKVQVAELTANKIKQTNLAETTAVMGMYSSMAGKVANTFMQIAQAGGEQSKEAFIMYKVFAIAQAGIEATMAVLNTLASPLLPPPTNIAMASVIGAMAAAQVAMIAAAQPPSYDQGGISHARGVYQTGDIDEAHIPLKGGAIPVEMEKQKEREPVEVTILNAFDPAMIDEYMYSSQGQSAILNVIGNHSQTVMRILR